MESGKINLEWHSQNRYHKDDSLLDTGQIRGSQPKKKQRFRDLT